LLAPLRVLRSIAYDRTALVGPVLDAGCDAVGQALRCEPAAAVLVAEFLLFVAVTEPGPAVSSREGLIREVIALLANPANRACCVAVFKLMSRLLVGEAPVLAGAVADEGVIDTCVRVFIESPHDEPFVVSALDLFVNLALLDSDVLERAVGRADLLDRLAGITESHNASALVRERVLWLFWVVLRVATVRQMAVVLPRVVGALPDSFLSDEDALLKTALFGGDAVLAGSPAFAEFLGAVMPRVDDLARGGGAAAIVRAYSRDRFF